MGAEDKEGDSCFHGGAFFEGIGVEFNNLNEKDNIISADVLDAWFPPAPKIQEVIQSYLPWIIKTSPPTNSEGYIKTISEHRTLNRESILPGAGSSDLIFRIFNQWLRPSSKVLILDPTYGEYSHILNKIIKCKVERLELKREEGYNINIDKLREKLNQKFDLFVWVNPNSPTGLHINKNEVERLLLNNKGCERIWIDETYVEYAGREQTLERFAEKSNNVFVCKSMSKVYALSGLRAAYLCANPNNIWPLKQITPPWVISLPAQIAATYALKQEDYYIKKYQETHELRDKLELQLKQIGIDEIIPGIANFIMFHVDNDKFSASRIVNECKLKKLYLRDLSGMGKSFEDDAIRMAVKDLNTNNKMIEILKECLNKFN
jgi:histidinol-phosphate/aromatic aminotransferase/cobyric acid decarboxylase-like protein